MSNTSLSLGNLRAFAIVLVVGFHSTLAYVVFKPEPLPLATPPYAWKAFPISDPTQWFGLDVICAFPYVTLMQLMFFLSGLFVWPSLRRKGTATFVLDRLWRLGVPFILGVAVLMPVAHYPVYAVSALNPTWPDFWEQWLSVPFWHSGPLWFLWVLVAFDLAAAALYRFAPALGERLAASAARAADAPGRSFIIFAAAAALAYLPFAAFFRPWDWVQFGPFSFQPSLFAHYAVFFFAGLGIGAGGLETGLLRSDGVLARRWAMWTSVAAASFVAWMLLTALTLDDKPLGIGPFPQLNVVVNLVFALTAAATCFAFAGMFLRFAARRWTVADELSKNAYAIYLFHYLFVVWLQYALLSLTLPAVVKAVIAFATALLLSWAASVAAQRLLEHARKFGAALRPS
ncbi:MAG: acyltransferase [Xanthobacteraceae bacterium]|nr:acyltransferase [Xanthobacteraceae bacterium]